MASMKYHKDCKRWRVFWHATLSNGQVDKGSKSFKEKTDAQSFKEKIEKKENQLKRAVIVEVPCLEEAVEEWKDFMGGAATAAAMSPPAKWGSNKISFPDMKRDDV